MTEEDRKSPATGTTDREETDLHPATEPVVTGSLFLTLLILVIIGGVWIIMYNLLLHR
jgi:hypothetical protein